jgi:hypothetical protein
LSLLLQEHIALEVVRQILEPQLSPHSLNPNASHQLACHRHHPGAKHMLDFSPSLGLRSVRGDLLFTQGVIAIRSLMNLADILQDFESGFNGVTAIGTIAPNLITLIIGVSDRPQGLGIVDGGMADRVAPNEAMLHINADVVFVYCGRLKTGRSAKG